MLHLPTPCQQGTFRSHGHRHDLGPEAQQLGGDLLVAGPSGDLARRGFVRFQNVHQLQCGDQLVGSSESSDAK